MGGKALRQIFLYSPRIKVLKSPSRNPWRTGYVPVFSGSDDEKELICSVIGS